MMARSALHFVENSVPAHGDAESLESLNGLCTRHRSEDPQASAEHALEHQQVAALLSPWQRANNAEGDRLARLQVPERSFFRRGAHYCFVAVEVRQEDRDSLKLQQLLTTISYELSLCLAKSDDACTRSVLAGLA